MCGRGVVEEQHQCNFGLSRRYRPLLESGDMRVTGTDAEGDPGVVELAGHPFFVAALFRPEMSALSGAAHPLISAYVRAAASHRRSGAGAGG